MCAPTPLDLFCFQTARGWVRESWRHDGDGAECVKGQERWINTNKTLPLICNHSVEVATLEKIRAPSPCSLMKGSFFPSSSTFLNLRSCFHGLYLFILLIWLWWNARFFFVSLFYINSVCLHLKRTTLLKLWKNSRWNNIEVYRARDVSFSMSVSSLSIVKIKREMLKLRPSSHLALRLCHSLMELHPFQMTESIMVACTTLQRMHCMHWIYFCYLLIMCVNSSAFILLLMSWKALGVVGLWENRQIYFKGFPEEE